MTVSCFIGIEFVGILCYILAFATPPPLPPRPSNPSIFPVANWLDFPEVLPEALCSLTNIASTEYTKAVTEEPDAVATVVMFLRHSDPYLREQV